MKANLRRFTLWSIPAGVLLVAGIIAHPVLSAPKNACLIGTDECYTSPQELVAAQRKKQRREREAASALPFDYRDLVQALLIDYLKPPADGSAASKTKLFVNVFDRPLDADSIQVLAQRGIKVSPDADRPPPAQPNRRSTSTACFDVTISSIKKLNSDGRYQVSFGFYCGPLCAGGFEYELQQAGKTWTVVERRSLWVS